MVNCKDSAPNLIKIKNRVEAVKASEKVGVLYMQEVALPGKR